MVLEFFFLKMSVNYSFCFPQRFNRLRKERIIASLDCYHFTKNVFLFPFQQLPGTFSATGSVSRFSTEHACEARKPSLCQNRGGQSPNRCCLQASRIHQRYQVTKLATAKPSRCAKEISYVLFFLSTVMKSVLEYMIEFIAETHSHPSKILKGLQRIATAIFLSEVYHKHFL